jgi:hypothetical protein
MMHSKHRFVPAVTLKTTTIQNNAHLEKLEVEATDDSCLTIESVHSIPRFFVSEEQLRSRLMRELTLVHGIGTKQEQRCRKQGIQTVSDLLSTNWKIGAQKIAGIIQNGTPQEIIELFQDAALTHS